ncbi:hypothetical protein [Alloactinosynnema sp. L-07]|uniref:hypothetical protein n=1 Tax=Alloactinosynnema sp. L-07 TaxID=1653480 RepID=UPI00065F05E0|nr:hypothetical protein [Alloactinosynnema sp. L-07]CRK55261.1 hypothetical protein [Alloactinosynnema sp. L-07]
MPDHPRRGGRGIAWAADGMAVCYAVHTLLTGGLAGIARSIVHQAMDVTGVLDALTDRSRLRRGEAVLTNEFSQVRVILARSSADTAATPDTTDLLRQNTRASCCSDPHVRLKLIDIDHALDRKVRSQPTDICGRL